MKSMVISFCLILGSVCFGADYDPSEKNTNLIDVDQYIIEIRDSMILFMMEEEERDRDSKLGKEPRGNNSCYYSSNVVNSWLDFHKRNKLSANDSSKQNNKKEFSSKLEEAEKLVGMEFKSLALWDQICRSLAGH